MDEKDSFSERFYFPISLVCWLDGERADERALIFALSKSKRVVHPDFRSLFYRPVY